MKKLYLNFIVFAILSFSSSCVLRDWGEAHFLPLKAVVRTALNKGELQIHRSPAIFEKNKKFEIQGLRKILSDADSTLNILMIHGMRSKKFDHFFPLMDDIAGKLGFQNLGSLDYEIKANELNYTSYTIGSYGMIGRNIEIDPIDTSFLNNYIKNSIFILEYNKRIEQSSDDNQNKKLRFYSVNWSPVVNSIKQNLYSLDAEKGRSKVPNMSRNNTSLSYLEIRLYIKIQLLKER